MSIKTFSKNLVWFLLLTLLFAIPTVTFGEVKDECTYNIFPTNKTFESSGGSGTISVTSQSRCGWTVSENYSWITITSGNSGNGNGDVSFTVDANTCNSSRTATIAISGTITGKEFSISQSGVSVFTTLTRLTISGPSSVNENSTATYTAKATWNDGTQTTVTPNWSENSTYTTIDTSGKLTTHSVTNNKSITITASFSDRGVTKSDTHSVTIVDTNIDPYINYWLGFTSDWNKSSNWSLLTVPSGTNNVLISSLYDYDFFPEVAGEANAKKVTIDNGKLVIRSGYLSISSSSVGSKYIFLADFEENTIGTFPVTPYPGPGICFLSGELQAEVQLSCGENNTKNLVLYDSSVGDHQNVAVYFKIDKFARGTINIQWDTVVLNSEGDQYGWVYSVAGLADSDGAGSPVLWDIHLTDNRYCVSGTTWCNDSDLKLGGINHFNVSCDTESQKFTVSIDEQVIVQDRQFNNLEANNFSGIVVETFWDSKATVGIDNIEIMSLDTTGSSY